MEDILKTYIDNHNLTLLNYWKGQEITSGCKSGQIRNSYCLVKNNANTSEYYISIVNENDDKYDIMLFDDIIKFRNIENINYPIWYKLSNGYIGTTIRLNNKKVFRYFHQHIMNYFSNTDKTKSIDHINRNPLDNRLSNLRIINQSHQNHNQTDRPRGTNLDTSYDTLKQFIPKNIYFKKATTDKNGLTHGEHFTIEIKFTTADNVKHRIRKKTTKAQNITLPVKLIQAIKIKFQIINGSKPLQQHLDIYTPDNLEEYKLELQTLIKNIADKFNIANTKTLIELLDTNISFNKKLEKINCPHCNKSLTGKSSLTRHVKTKH